MSSTYFSIMLEVGFSLLIIKNLVVIIPFFIHTIKTFEFQYANPSMFQALMEKKNLAFFESNHFMYQPTLVNLNCTSLQTFNSNIKIFFWFCLPYSLFLISIRQLNDQNRKEYIIEKNFVLVC